MKICKKCNTEFSSRNCPICKKMYQKIWVKNNPDKVKKYDAVYYQKNKEKKRLSQRENKRRNEQNRRARKKASEGTLTRGIINKLLVLQKFKCPACLASLKENKYHLDHIMPLALGGSNKDDNVQVLCQKCNNQKYSKHPVDFMQSKRVFCCSTKRGLYE